MAIKIPTGVYIVFIVSSNKIEKYKNNCSVGWMWVFCEK